MLFASFSNFEIYAVANLLLNKSIQTCTLLLALFTVLQFCVIFKFRKLRRSEPIAKHVDIISTFQRSLTLVEINEFINKEDFKFLVVEVNGGKWFGFNMKNNDEKEIAEDILSDNWRLCTMEEYIIGWKIAKKKPSWAKNVFEWHKFVRQMEQKDLSSDIDDNENDEEDYDEDYSDNQRNLNLKQDSNYSIEGENDNEPRHSGSNSESIDDYTDDSGEDNNKSHKHVESSESEEDSKKSYKHNTTSTRKQNIEKKTNEEDSAESNKDLDDISKITPSDMGAKFEDADSMFEKLLGNDFKSNFDKNIKSASSSKQMEIFITGPFRNHENNTSVWVVVFGNLNNAFVLKASFVETYLKTLLSGLKHSNMSFKYSNIDINHCETYNDINIRQKEFGNNNDWRRTIKGKTVSRLSFVYSCDTSNEANAKKCLPETIEFFFKSMAKRKKHPIGPMVIDYLRDFQKGLYDYVLKSGKNGQMNEDDAGKKLTDDIHNEFQLGYKLTWNDSLDRYMVDYDIIRILKDYAGCSKWEDIDTTDKKKCYCHFNNEFSLPRWDIQQERF